jgi:hypothetical protein
LIGDVLLPFSLKRIEANDMSSAPLKIKNKTKPSPMDLGLKAHLCDRAFQ